MTCEVCGAGPGQHCQPRYIGDRHAERSIWGHYWGHTLIHWVVQSCPGCRAELEVYDPDAGPMFDDPYCRTCTTRDRCPPCGEPGKMDCVYCHGDGLDHGAFIKDSDPQVTLP